MGMPQQHTTNFRLDSKRSSRDLSSEAHHSCLLKRFPLYEGFLQLKQPPTLPLHLEHPSFNAGAGCDAAGRRFKAGPVTAAAGLFNAAGTPLVTSASLSIDAAGFPL
jgi:hypothetical protein